MGTTLATALYVPDVGETGWGALFDAGLTAHDDYHLRPQAAASTTMFPEQWASRTRGVNYGDAGWKGAWAGTWWQPFRTLHKAYAGDGVDGTHLYGGLPDSGTGVKTGKVKVVPGPRFDASGTVGTFPSNAEYFVFDSVLGQLVLNGSVWLESNGAGAEQSGQAWHGGGNLQANALIVSDPTFPDATALVNHTGSYGGMKGMQFKQTKTNGICWQASISGTGQGHNKHFWDCTTSGGLVGSKYVEAQTDECYEHNCYHALHTLYGTYSMGNQAANNIHLEDGCGYYWCGSTAGSVAATGAAICFESGGGYDSGNMGEVGGCIIFGGSPALLVLGGHMVDFHHNQVELSGLGSNGVTDLKSAITGGTNVLTTTTTVGPWTSGMVGKKIVVVGAGTAGANLVTTVSGFTNSKQISLTANASTTVSNVLSIVDPIIDRPFIKTDGAPGSTAEDGYAAALGVHHNYMHQAGTYGWTSGIGAHYHFKKLLQATIESNQTWLPGSALTTANPLMVCEATAKGVIGHLGMVFDAENDRGTRITALNRLVADAGVGNGGTYWNGTRYASWGSYPPTP